MSKITKYSVRDLKRDFPTDEACLDFIFEALHSPKCSCGGSYKKLFKTVTKNNLPVLEGRKQYQCSKCRFQIAPASGTIFHKSDTPLTLWFHAIWVFSNAKSGISAKEMERQLGVTYKCAWRILSLIREALKQEDKKLRGDVEIDTGYFGGRGKAGPDNLHLSKIMAKKGIVIAAVERGGRIKAELVGDSRAETMQDFIEKNIEVKATTIMTDNSKVYLRSDKTHSRYFVDHHKGQYVKADIHINTIETFFAHLKRSFRGTFKKFPKKHLQAYLDAFVWHYNNRHNDKERFASLVGTLLHASR